MWIYGEGNIIIDDDDDNFHDADDDDNDNDICRIWRCTMFNTEGLIYVEYIIYMYVEYRAGPGDRSSHNSLINIPQYGDSVDGRMRTPH